MKALGKLHEKPGIWLYEAPKPEVGDLEVLIRIKHTAICGTDLHIYQWDEWAARTIPTPMTVGHEFMGEIVALGRDVKGFDVGDSVSGEGHITCGVCRNCRAGKMHLCRKTQGIGVNHTGCFAEYLAMPARNVFRLAEHIPDEIGAILDPFGNAVHTTLSFDLVGEDVLITGAGPIGIMAAKVAKWVGARHVVITDINPHRLALAKAMGIEHVVDVTQTSLSSVMSTLGMQEGFDVGLEMSGVPAAFEQMIAVLNHGARVALLGILPSGAGIDWSAVIFKSLQIKGIYGREMFETWYKMSSLLSAGLDISGIITHRFSYEQYQEAFDVMASGQSGKVILSWS